MYDVLVSLSGGIDSCLTTRLLMARGLSCAALHIDFRQPTSTCDRESAIRFCSRYGVPLEIVEFETSSAIPTTEIADRLPGLGALLTIAACCADSIAAADVALGLLRGEVAEVTADPRWDLLQAFLVGSGVRPRRAILPLCDLEKADVIQLAAAHGIHFDARGFC